MFESVSSFRAGLGMCRVAMLLAVGAVLAATCSLAEESGSVLVRTVAPLDEPRGLCIDIPGHRDRVRVSAALVVHSCKWGMWNFDERFDRAALERGRLRMPEYGLCASAAEAAAGARVMLAECGSSQLLAWKFSGGLLRLGAEPGLCITVGPEASELTPGGQRLPSRHVARSLGLEPCGDAARDRQRWTLAPPG